MSLLSMTQKRSSLAWWTRGRCKMLSRGWWSCSRGCAPRSTCLTLCLFISYLIIIISLRTNRSAQKLLICSIRQMNNNSYILCQEVSVSKINIWKQTAHRWGWYTTSAASHVKCLAAAFFTAISLIAKVAIQTGDARKTCNNKLDVYDLTDLVFLTWVIPAFEFPENKAVTEEQCFMQNKFAMRNIFRSFYFMTLKLIHSHVKRYFKLKRSLAL